MLIQKDFSEEYLSEIKFYCIVMTENYIENNFSDIIKFENVIEHRLGGDVSKSELIDENKKNLKLCKKYNLNYILIDKVYEVKIKSGPF